ncbi:hypothetical protein P792_09990 [Asaia sp. SF2.1]|nr:hypothetical protein P792_09990 [Asaia sp. SF2.1]
MICVLPKVLSQALGTSIRLIGEGDQRLVASSHAIFKIFMYRILI